jgi:hypothetical protein
MTDEQQRIAIAEACGWFFMYDSWHYPNGAEAITILDYLNDLNAMHEAEKTLNPIKAAEYARMLTSIAWQSEQPVFAPMTATARQRAEAFLKTLGKWEEEE